MDIKPLQTQQRASVALHLHRRGPSVLTVRHALFAYIPDRRFQDDHFLFLGTKRPILSHANLASVMHSLRNLSTPLATMTLPVLISQTDLPMLVLLVPRRIQQRREASALTDAITCDPMTESRVGKLVVEHCPSFDVVVRRRSKPLADVEHGVLTIMALRYRNRLVRKACK